LTFEQPKSGEAADVQKIMEGLRGRTFSPFYYWRVPVIGQYLMVWVLIDRVRKMMDRVVCDYERDQAHSSRT
jgi:hypothetical protein